jgi:ubiquinone/menaquinone biosynthesis C-methylase UbiE
VRTITLVLVSFLVTGCGSGFKQWAYESGRDQWQRADEVVAALGLAPGARVADLGAGSGYFTRRLAAAVGAEGRVYAVDVDAEMNERLRARLAAENVSNVEVVLGEYGDPKLPDGAIDLVFTSNTYHHIQDRPAYFRDLQRDLAPGGRVAIIDYDGRKGLLVRLIGHYTEKDVVLREMDEAGYRVVEDTDFLDRQSFVIFALR